MTAVPVKRFTVRAVSEVRWVPPADTSRFMGAVGYTFHQGGMGLY